MGENNVAISPRGVLKDMDRADCPLRLVRPVITRALPLTPISGVLEIIVQIIITHYLYPPLILSLIEWLSVSTE